MIDIVARIGGTQIGGIEISCIEGRGRQPDSVNVYEATIRHEDNGFGYDPPPPPPLNVTVEHRFGDDWTVLVRKVLEAAEVHNHERNTHAR